MGVWGSFLDWLSGPETKDVTFTPADAEHGFSGHLPRTGFSYRRSIRDGLDSNVVMAPVHWMCRNFTQADVVVERRNSERSWSEMPDHDLKLLLDKPNDFYDGDMLWKATLVSRELDGNAYWRKVRNAFGEVIQLWYLPHFLVEPKYPADGSEFISHYEWRPFGFGRPVEVQTRDIVHFRLGLDPRNPRLGMSPLKPLLREVFTDEEASNFSAAILRNMGVPGGVLSPKDAGQLPGKDDIKEMKDYMRTAFTGDRRGEWFVTGIPTEIKQFGFDPSQLLLTNLRDITEERVCAMLGIPAAVVGFGSGLQSTKVGAPQPLSARLWTPNGPTTMGDVAVGDPVATPAGWQEVRAVYPQGEQDIYRITFQDGSTAESTIDHLWEVHTPKQGWRTVPLSEVASWSRWKLIRAHLPLQGVTKFDTQECLIPPYVLGLLLADGSFRSNLSFSNSNTEIVEAIASQVGSEYAVNRYADDVHDYRIAYREASQGRGIGGGTGDLNPFKDEIRRLGLWMLYSHEKFIPDLYKYNSVEVRRQLLQGILDGDGFVNQHGQPAIEQTSDRLADDITEVVQSLGGYTLRSEKKANRRTRYINGRPMASRRDRVHLSIVVENASSLFYCAEKRERCRPRSKKATRKFRSIEFVRREAAQCIKLDGGLYLTDNFLVTHNTMRELREEAWASGIEPRMRTLARAATDNLVPDFQSQARRYRVRFDTSRVPALMERNANVQGQLVKDGIQRVDRAQDALGLEVDDSQSVYLRPSTTMAVPAETEIKPPAPPPSSNGRPPPDQANRLARMLAEENGGDDE